MVRSSVSNSDFGQLQGHLRPGRIRGRNRCSIQRPVSDTRFHRDALHLQVGDRRPPGQFRHHRQAEWRPTNNGSSMLRKATFRDSVGFLVRRLDRETSVHDTVGVYDGPLAWVQELSLQTGLGSTNSRVHVADTAPQKSRRYSLLRSQSTIQITLLCSIWLSQGRRGVRRIASRGLWTSKPASS